MQTEFRYITANPQILGGKPIIKHTRISVEIILEWMMNGASVEEIVTEYPRLSKEAVFEVLRYATFFNKNDVIKEIKISA